MLFLARVATVSDVLFYALSFDLGRHVMGRHGEDIDSADLYLGDGIDEQTKSVSIFKAEHVSSTLSYLLLYSTRVEDIVMSPKDRPASAVDAKEQLAETVPPNVQPAPPFTGPVDWDQINSYVRQNLF